MRKRFFKTVMFVFAFCLLAMGEKTIASAATKLSACKITVKDATLKNGKATPAVVVKYKNKSLKNGTDYKITVTNNKKIGTATCKIVGMKAYTGTVTKKFKVVPEPAKNLKVEVQKYEDGNQATILKWTPVKDVTGYILYVSDKKDGVYYEAERLKAENWNKMSIGTDNYVKGSYLKLRSFVYKNGTYYMSEYSKPVQVTKRSLNKEEKMRDYQVTNAQMKAPTDLKLVYASPTDYYGATLPETLCLQFTNASDSTVKDWYIEIADQDGKVFISINAGWEVAAGESVLLPLADNLLTNLVPGVSVTKIRVMGMDGGSDGWTSSPWAGEYGMETDDTFGPAAILNCKIDINLKQKGTLAGTFGKTEWGDDCLKVKPAKTSYDSLSVFVHSQNGGQGGKTGGADESGYYSYSLNDPGMKDTIKDCLTITSVGGLDASGIKVKNDTTASVTIDCYTVTLKK